MKKSQITQRMVNEYPAWSSTRADEQSLGFQVVNVVANKIEDLDRQLLRVSRNNYISSVNLFEPDLVYRYDLPGTWEFTSDSDTAKPKFTAPVVTGSLFEPWYQANTANLLARVMVTHVPENDVEHMWDAAIPTRYKIGDSLESFTEVLNSTVGEAPFTTSTDVAIPGKLWVVISESTRCFRTDDSGNNITGLVVIAGKTRRGLDETETLVFLHNNILQTTKDWEVVDRIDVHGIEPASATIRVTSLLFNSPFHIDQFNLARGSETNRSVDTFWSVSSGDSLDTLRYSVQDRLSQLSGNTVKDIVDTYRVLDWQGLVIENTLDLAPTPNLPLIWTVSNDGRLHLYSTDQYLPSTSSLTRKVWDSEARIEVDSYHKRLSDSGSCTVSIGCYLERNTKQVVKYKLTRVGPSGLPITDGWLDVTVGTDMVIAPPEDVVLEESGDWVFSLDVEFSDGSQTTDQRIVSVQDKIALCSLDLSTLLPEEESAIAIAWDSDYRLWVKGEGSTIYRVDLAYDYMIVDWERKVIYFRENYNELALGSVGPGEVDANILTWFDSRDLEDLGYIDLQKVGLSGSPWGGREGLGSELVRISDGPLNPRLSLTPFDDPFDGRPAINWGSNLEESVTGAVVPVNLTGSGGAFTLAVVDTNYSNVGGTMKFKAGSDATETGGLFRWNDPGDVLVCSGSDDTHSLGGAPITVLRFDGVDSWDYATSNLGGESATINTGWTQAPSPEDVTSAVNLYVGIQSSLGGGWAPTAFAVWDRKLTDEEVYKVLENI